MQHRDVQCVARGQGGKKPGEPGGKHRFAGSRRSDHQQIVTSGRRDFQHPARGFLPFQVGHVRHAVRWSEQFGPRVGQQLKTAKVIEKRHQVRRRHYPEIAGPGGLGPACLRADQIHAGADSRHRRRQHARHRLDAAMKRQFAKNKSAVHGVGRQRAGGDKQAQRDGKVVMRTFLDHIRRRQIDGDPFRRQCQPD